MWEELRGQRIFVTGATGFFGMWLLESFAWANQELKLEAELMALTRNADAFRAKAPHLCSRKDIQLHVGDVRDFKFPSGKFSHVIHAATEASAKLNSENPFLMFDTCVTGTKRALEFAQACEAKKFLLTSSGAVYGAQPMERVPEDFLGGPDILNAGAAYAEGKRASEQLCAIQAQSGPREIRTNCFDVRSREPRDVPTEIKIARCFAFVGPHLPLDAHFAIGNFIRDGLRGEPIKIGGDGTPYRSYLYAADLAIWLWTILFRGAALRAYNVGSSRAVTIAETAQAVAGVFEGKPAIEIAQNPVLGKAAQRYVPDVSRAEKELGLKDWVGLEEAIRRTRAWHETRS
jgi:dTDP-glucose 4,6-dehydratase